MTVPPHVLAASLSALGLHDAFVAVARLDADSVLGQVPVPEGADRLLVFRAARPDQEITITIAVTRADGGTDGGSTDGGSTDGGSTDGGSTDSGGGADGGGLQLEVSYPASAELAVVQPGADVSQRIQPGSSDGGDRRQVRISAVTSGLTSIVLRYGDGSAVRTAWLVL